MDTGTSPLFTSPEAKAFYQSRVASFGLLIATAGAVGFLFRLLIGLTSGTLIEKLGDPSYWLHVAAFVPCVAMWLFCRDVPRPLNSVIAVLLDRHLDDRPLDDLGAGDRAAGRRHRKTGVRLHIG